MTNNDSFRSLRYTFNLNDSKMIKIFSLANLHVTREQVSSWLKREDDPDYKSLKGSEFASFLNGFIIKKRGKKDGPAPEPENWMTNNLILKKLKIALKLTSDDIKDILSMSNFPISDHELSALLRRRDHKHFRQCQDQILRLFLKGLQLKYRPEETAD
ncbi:MAG: DUF1456 family protein [Bdellovibrionales bacterium]